MPELELLINGTAHSGWLEVSVQRSMEQLADTFSVSFTDRWTGAQQRAAAIRDGDACEVKLAGKRVVTGYVDEVELEYEAESRTMSASGRSKTADLVDCSAIFQRGKGQWRDQSFERIARDIAEPFGIGVVVDAQSAASKFRRFALQDGETAHEALERAARMRGVLLLTDGDGRLVLTRASAKRTQTVIERGVNVLRGSGARTKRDRYSTYVVKAQVAGDDEFSGASAAAPKRESADAEVKRYRPLIVQGEAQEVGAELQARADWERNVRAGRGARLAYTVQGWECAEGPWAPNVLVRVKDDFLGVDGEMLIIRVHQSLGEGGTTTELELATPESMSVEPLKQKASKAAKGGFVL